MQEYILNKIDIYKLYMEPEGGGRSCDKNLERMLGGGSVRARVSKVQGRADSHKVSHKTP